MKTKLTKQSYRNVPTAELRKSRQRLNEAIGILVDATDKMLFELERRKEACRPRKK